ncbi:MAG: discoidin domain-containing protein [Candidatus Omnitrophota bacterium]|nr:discoidin domain-containing protein [Candidatus Omnitrophota bacterium]
MGYSVSKESVKKTLWAALFIIAIFLCQWFLFRSFVTRELAWSPYIHDDETWYLAESYEIFDHLLAGQHLPALHTFGPYGFLFNVEMVFSYLFFGASRLTSLGLNFFYYLAAQLAVFVTVYKIARNRSLAYTALGLALLIPGSLFLGTLTVVTHEFCAQSLFWIFVSLVLGSNIFLDRKWSLAAGFAGGVLMLTRYYYSSFIMAAYFFPFALCAVLFIAYRKRSDRETQRAAYLLRIKNIFVSGLIPLVMCGPVFWSIRKILYAHLLESVSGISKEFDYIVYGQGAGSGAAKYLFYISHAGKFFSNQFWLVSIVLLAIAALGVVIMKLKNKNRGAGFNRPPVADFALTALFIAVCLVVPYVLLTTKANKAGQLAGVFMASPYWIIMLAIIGMYNRGSSYAVTGRILSKLALLTAVIALSAGLLFQINLYGRHAHPASSPEIRRDMMTISGMYNDIGNLCEEKGWQSPAISVDNWVWYLYGNAWNLKSWHYERRGVMLDIQPMLGNNPYFTFDEKKAMSMVRTSDIVILGVPQKGICPVLAPDVKEIVWKFTEKEFKFLKSYFIEDSAIRVYYRTKPLKDADPRTTVYFDKSRFCTITASSNGAGHYGYRAFDGSTDADDFWESEAGEFPQWIQAACSGDIAVANYEVKSGYAELDRMPKDWKLQGSKDGTAWEDLDERHDEINWKLYETRRYAVKNPSAYLYYRFYIMSASNPLTRIYEIKLEE